MTEEDTTHQAWRQDAVSNAFSGLGTAKDRDVYTRPAVGRSLTDREILDLYLYDRFARLIVDRPAEDATRRGWKIEVEDSDDGADPFADDLKSLGARQKFRKADQWARLRGGAGVLMIVDDNGALNEPIQGKVRGVKALHVFSRPELVPAQWEGDIESPNFGEPTHYFLHPHARRGAITTNAGWGDIVHADRVIRFEGLPIPEDAIVDYDRQHWGQPVIEAAWEAIKDISASSQAIASAMHEAQFGIVKLKNLKGLIAAGKDDPNMGLQARLDAIALGRSYLRSIILDSEEEYELRHSNLSGLLEAYEVAQQNLSAVTQIPLTLLFGQAPKGFSSSDDTGLQNYYDGVRSRQTEVYEPAICRLTDLLAEARGKADLVWSVKFHDLDTPNEKEEAEIRKIYADADTQNIQMGVYTPEEARTRYAQTGFAGDLVLDTDDPSDDLSYSEMMERLPEAMPEAMPQEGTTEEPLSQGAPSGGGGEESLEVEQLNGAQITALSDIVQQVSRGELPRSAGRQILQVGFNFTEQQADGFFEDIDEVEQPAEEEDQ